MSDIVVSLFTLENEQGYSTPKFDVQYEEKDTGQKWIINLGGTRAYFIRLGDKLLMDFEEQSADSHFMVKRITTSLFLGGCGLFRAKSAGRFMLEDIKTAKFEVHTHLDLWHNLSKGANNKLIINEVTDWYIFICQNTLFRRAGDDAYTALLNPVEADF